MKKRTHVDFSQHVVTVTKHEKTLIHEIAKPESSTHSVTFINTNGIMAVTGDFGNWIFNREFHPGISEFVSDTYWTQKLRVASSQDPYEFDPAKAKEQIVEILRTQTLTEEEESWIHSLLSAADDGEYSYIAKAMDYPSSFESEMIPQGKIMKFWLEAVYDAFDEICKREDEKFKQNVDKFVLKKLEEATSV